MGFTSNNLLMPVNHYFLNISGNFVFTSRKNVLIFKKDPRETTCKGFIFPKWEKKNWKQENNIYFSSTLVGIRLLFNVHNAIKK